MSDQIGPPTPKRKTRRRRRLHWHLGIWMVLALLLFTLFLVFASMSLTGRVYTLPEGLTARLSEQIDTRLENAGISLGRVELGVSPEGYPRLRLVNVGIKDQTGLEVAQLNAVEGGVRFWPLLRGEVVPKGLSLSGAQVTVRRRSNGEFDLSFGQAAGASAISARFWTRWTGCFPTAPWPSLR